MRGAGLQPAGTSSAGFGAPTASADDNTIALADTANGGAFGSRLIDPSTNDYVLGDSGRLVGMPDVQQDVLLAILNAKPRLQAIDRLLPGFQREILAILTSEFQAMIDLALVEIVGVTARVGRNDGLKEGQAVVRFQWRDVSANTVHESEL